MVEQLKQYATYMWQEQKRHPFYRIQTNDPEINRKLHRRSRCKLAVKALNSNLWVYRVTYSSPKKAFNGLMALTLKEVSFVDQEDIFVSYTYPKLYLKKGHEVLSNKEKLKWHMQEL